MAGQQAHCRTVSYCGIHQLFSNGQEWTGENSGGWSSRLVPAPGDGIPGTTRGSNVGTTRCANLHESQEPAGGMGPVGPVRGVPHRPGATVGLPRAQCRSRRLQNNSSHRQFAGTVDPCVPAASTASISGRVTAVRREFGQNACGNAKVFLHSFLQYRGIDFSHQSAGIAPTL